MMDEMYHDREARSREMDRVWSVFRDDVERFVARWSRLLMGTRWVRNGIDHAGQTVATVDDVEAALWSVVDADGDRFFLYSTSGSGGMIETISVDLTGGTG